MVSFRRSSLSSGVDVEVKAPGKADALADALELELLIVNLLKNAAAASKDSREKLISSPIVGRSKRMAVKCV